jgi:hypothetical protein
MVRAQATRRNVNSAYPARSWTTGVSAPCHFQLASILRFQTPVCVISAEIPDKNPEICLPACCMHDTPAITPAMATHAPVAAVCIPVQTCMCHHASSQAIATAHLAHTVYLGVLKQMQLTGTGTEYL